MTPENGKERQDEARSGIHTHPACGGALRIRGASAGARHASSRRSLLLGGATLLDAWKKIAGETQVAVPAALDAMVRLDGVFETAFGHTYRFVGRETAHERAHG